MNFGLRVNTFHSCQIVIFSADCRKSSNIKFHENPFTGSRVVLCELTGRRTDMTKLIVAFRNFANAPKNEFKSGH